MRSDAYELVERHGGGEHNGRVVDDSELRESERGKAGYTGLPRGREKQVQCQRCHSPPNLPLVLNHSLCLLPRVWSTRYNCFPQWP